MTLEPVILRQIHLSDSEALYHLAQKAPVGLTSLPREKEAVKQAVARSEQSFSEKTFSPSSLFWFVLEEPSSQTIQGISGIHAQMEGGKALYSYVFQEESEGVLTKRRLLLPRNKIWQASELCSLYLRPEARKRGLAKILSYSRFLYIFLHPHLFLKQITARYRGYFDKEGKSPFWECVGKALSGKSYTEFLEITRKDPTSILSFLPKHPIYFDLLPKAAKSACKRVHPNTQGAVKLVKKLGFHQVEDLDLFDAGPFYSAAFDELVFFRNIHTLPPFFSSDPLSQTLLLVVRKSPFTVLQCKGKIANKQIHLPFSLRNHPLLQQAEAITAVRIY
jgi:arginine N-succinyltransferase